MSLLGQVWPCWGRCDLGEGNVSLGMVVQPSPLSDFKILLFPSNDIQYCSLLIPHQPPVLHPPWWGQLLVNLCSTWRISRTMRSFDTIYFHLAYGFSRSWLNNTPLCEDHKSLAHLADGHQVVIPSCPHNYHHQEPSCTVSAGVSTLNSLLHVSGKKLLNRM